MPVYITNLGLTPPTIADSDSFTDTPGARPGLMEWWFTLIA